MCQTFTQEYTATPTTEKKTFPVPSFYKGEFYGLRTYYALLESGVVIIDSNDHGNHSIRISPRLSRHDTLNEQIDVSEFIAAYDIAHAAIDTVSDAAHRLISIPSPVLTEAV